MQYPHGRILTSSWAQDKAPTPASHLYSEGGEPPSVACEFTCSKRSTSLASSRSHLGGNTALPVKLPNPQQHHLERYLLIIIPKNYKTGVKKGLWEAKFTFQQTPAPLAPSSPPVPGAAVQTWPQAAALGRFPSIFWLRSLSNIPFHTVHMWPLGRKACQMHQVFPAKSPPASIKTRVQRLGNVLKLPLRSNNYLFL